MLKGLSLAVQALWWRPRPGVAAWLMWPLACLVQGLARLDQMRCERGRRARFNVPVVVVGNLVVGGAGKTPTVLALIDALRARGWQPGVISRGYGRPAPWTDQLHDLGPASTAAQAGDEPLLIHRRSGAPVVVGRDRVAAAQALLAAHPQVDLLISDDGLQHHRLARDLQILVFDGRGAGNGLTLPAGPLRQALARELPANTWVLYNAARPSTRLPGVLARRELAGAIALDAWWRGEAPNAPCLAELARRSQAGPLLAAAGLAEPERFFCMLEARGLHIRRCPLPDHANLDVCPWPDETGEVLVTEKDAVKLPVQAAPWGRARVWVVTLDFALPPAWVDELDQALRALPHPNRLAPVSPTLPDPTRHDR